MADLFQIVTIDKLAARKTVVFPITNDTGKSGGGSRYEIVRDTLKINPPKANQIVSASDRRFGGGRIVGETHDNGTIDMELYANGGSANANDSITAAEAVVAQLQSPQRGRYLEYRPDGATTSTYYELRGPGPWDNMYKWIEFQANRTVHIKTTFQVAPLALGDPMDVYEDWTTDDRFAAWTYYQGTFSSLNYLPTTPQKWRGGGLVTWSGGLGTGTVLAVRSDKGYQYGDVQVSTQWVSSDLAPTGGSSSTYVSNVLNSKDASNYIDTRLWWTGTDWSLRVVKIVAGSATALAQSATTFTLATSTRYWLVSRQEGNKITVELHTAEPRPGRAPEQSVVWTLAGGDENQFGIPSGPGNVGWKVVGIQGTSTGWQMEAWRAEAFTYVNQVYPATVDLFGDVPGTAPALADVTFGRAGQGPWAALGWLGRSSSARISDEANGGATVHTPFGVLPYNNAVYPAVGGGWSSTADTNTLAGNFELNSTINPGLTYTWYWKVDPSLMVPDDFQDVVMLEAYVRLRMDSTWSYPRLYASMLPDVNTALPSLYPVEFGTLGRPILNVPQAPTTAAWRVVRAGTFVVPAEAFGQVYRLSFDLTFAAGTTGNIGVGWGLVLPAKQRAAGATGKTHDSTYPDFFRGAGYAERLDASLRGYAWLDDATNGVAGSNHVTPRMGPSAGLGGQLIEVEPGRNSVAIYGSSEVPDDPTFNANNETSVFGYATPTSYVHLSVWPRFFLGRS